MGTLGWVLLAAAFLVFMMVANNSWSWVWAKLRLGLSPGPQGPQEPTGEGNRILPVPPPSAVPDHIEAPPGSVGPPPGSIVPVPSEDSGVPPFSITPVP